MCICICGCSVCRSEHLPYAFKALESATLESADLVAPQMYFRNVFVVELEHFWA